MQRHYRGQISASKLQWLPILNITAPRIHCSEISNPSLASLLRCKKHTRTNQYGETFSSQYKSTQSAQHLNITNTTTPKNKLYIYISTPPPVQMRKP
ncbi:hypothetical protein AQUCO_00100791v1 [Aquilegia coerulea]|uniref:Uncharacterized protein n=1 Tax=Aquilegia coerulea TaxID=218851 RepID=A0A2G5FC46_AQUCA|nr:hypothetical protein AQUCO_00100791v1 [Aquilegia coerulea]